MSLSAWQLALGESLQIALAPSALVELITDAEPMALPAAAGACTALLRWQARLLPLFDFARSGDHQGAAVIAVLGFKLPQQSKALALAMRLLQPPRRIDLNDDQQCPLPAALPAPIRHAAYSCIRLDDGTEMPIVRLDALAQFDPSAHAIQSDQKEQQQRSLSA